MGEKTIENIRSALKFAERSSERLPLGRALPVAEHFVEQISKVKEVKQAAYAGSLRRGRETIGDVDILVATDKPGPVHDAFAKLDAIEQMLVAGETKSSARVRASVEKGKFKDKKGGPLVQVDLRTVPASSFGAAMLYFTGSKAHNVRLRERAIKKGLTLNEYGLFKDDGKGAAPQSRGVKPVASKTEADIYEALDLPYLPPEIREDRGELDANETPELVELDDIQCELHAHTRASDGGMPLEELVKQARQRGFHTIAVTDHSKSSIQANGLSVERLLEQIDEVHALAKKTNGIKILAGSEVDIMGDGKLDYDDDILAQLDHVVASPHTVLAQDDQAATKRLIKAIEHPSVRILGHPTGRLIGRREGLSPDMRKVIDAAKANDVALELNAHWHRLDLRDTHLRACVDAGCLIAINCDVHSPSDFDNLRYGILTARRGRVPAELCINTWGVRKLGAWLKR
jgi:DNA polymerase (family 10)